MYRQTMKLSASQNAYVTREVLSKCQNQKFKKNNEHLTIYLSTKIETNKK